MNLWGKNKRRTSTYQREFKEFLREQARLNELHKAMREVELYESYVQMLRTIHLEADEQIDWELIAAQDPETSPNGIGPRERQARKDLDDYRPSLWDKLFGSWKRKLQAREQRVAAARKEDRAAYRAWQERSALASRILAGDRTAYVEAVEKMKPFADLAQFGSEFTCYLAELAEGSEVLTVEFLVHSQKVIPHEAKSLTKTGKLSVSKLPVTRYHSLEQDYVCSTIFRIARDAFALLPLEEIIVHATDYQLNEAVGRMELVTILSVRIERKVLQSLHLPAIDPSEAIKNFEHRMNFLKTKGFRPVDKLAK